MILEIFLEAVFLSIVPVFAIFINCEWNFGRKFLASLIFPELRYIDICFTTDLYLFFLIFLLFLLQLFLSHSYHLNLTNVYLLKIIIQMILNLIKEFMIIINQDTVLFVFSGALSLNDFRATSILHMFH